MKLRTEIHSVPQDRSELIRKSEIAQSDTSQSPGLELRQHIKVALVRSKVITQCRAEKRKCTNPSFDAETSDSFAIYGNGYIGCCHSSKSLTPKWEPAKTLKALDVLLGSNHRKGPRGVERREPPPDLLDLALTAGMVIRPHWGFGVLFLTSAARCVGKFFFPGSAPASRAHCCALATMPCCNYVTAGRAKLDCFNRRA